jgi:hypothetical protein
MEPRFALPHADLFRVAAEVGRKVDDPWCSRLGAMHLLRLVEAAEEDMEKDLVTVSAADLKVYARALGDTEKSAVFGAVRSAISRGGLNILTIMPLAPPKTRMTLSLFCMSGKSERNITT